MFGFLKRNDTGMGESTEAQLEPVRRVVERLGGSTDDFDRIEPELRSVIEGYKSGLVTKREMKKRRKELLGSIHYD